MQKYFNNVTNRTGDVVPGAIVTVTLAATGALATIYSDDGVTTRANPITADNNGYFEFYAADGLYDLAITGSGIQALTISDVLIEDLSDLTGGEGASLVGYTPAGTGAVARTVQAKLREAVSVADFGGEAGVDCAAALVLAAAATTGPVLIPAGAWTCTATTSNSDDILGILDRIRCDGTLTIDLAAGTHALTEQIVINSPDAQRITIQGAATVSTTAASQVSVSGAAKAYSVIIGVASSAGAAVGDYAMVRTDVTGTGDYYAHAGVWKITAVDDGGANRLTLLNTHHGAAFPTNTLTGGAVVILKTMLQFTGCDGFRFEGGQPLGLLDRLAIVGDWNVSAATGTTGAHGIVMSAPVITGGASSNAVHNMAGGAGLGPSVGVSAWGEQGIAVSGRCTLLANFVASCSNRKRGWYSEGGHIRAKFAIGSGNGEDGFISDVSGAFQANSSIASGNGLNGFWGTNNSLLACASAVGSGNLAHGFEQRGGGRVSADSAIGLNNALDGFNASDGGNMDADSATASGNGRDGFAGLIGGQIDANNATSSGNTGFGAKVTYRGLINLSGGSVSGNTGGDYSAANARIIRADGTLAPNSEESGAYRIYNSAKSHYCDISLSSIGDVTISIDGSTRQTIKVGQGTRVIGVTPTTSAGELGLGSTTATTVGAAGAAAALPANPTGYLVVGIGGTAFKLPYYAS